MPLSIIPLDSSFMMVSSFSHNGTPGSHGSDLETGENVVFILLAALAILLLLLCAILAGLTLAICSLDITRLHVLSMVGDQKKRNQALVISRIKRHASWFLCSMIICSVACAESIPIIIELLFGTGWLPIVVSTIAIAIFAELLPQYLIPRNAIIWGYYCWPFIWGCMWLTCFISWPLSYLLDAIYGSPTDRGIYKLDELKILIKFHERAEKHGGLLGPDASRIMRSALYLDQLTLRGECQPRHRKGKAPLADVERGEASRAAILIPWSSVQTINITQEVTRDLILHIKSWAYSRIPVVGDIEAGDHESTECCGGWNNQKVYGFLHVKNLVGLELPDHDSQSKKLFVKDLPLYPLPVIRDDMPLYDLLNVFQLGMARIAVVIATPTKDRLVPLSASVGNRDALPRYGAPLWSVSTGLNARNNIEMAALDAHIDWTTDFLDAAQNDIESPLRRKYSIVGIGCPKPIGIVTYEDILDALLQKTSLDEKDFFGRNPVMIPTKAKKEGDFNSVSSNHSIVRTKMEMPVYATKVHADFERSEGRSYERDGILRRRIISGLDNRMSEENNDIIRRRNIAGPDDGVDGASEHSGQGFDGADERDTTSRVDTVDDRSSYTENTLGGFHDLSSSVEFVCDFELHSTNVDTTIMSKPPTLVLPEHLAVTDVNSGCPAKPCTSDGKSKSGAPTPVPRLRRVTPFSKQALMSYERTQENVTPTSKTVVRNGLPTNRILQDTSQNEEIRARDDSFHDDRTLLPSQRKQREGMTQFRGRLMSLWL